MLFSIDLVIGRKPSKKNFKNSPIEKSGYKFFFGLTEVIFSWDSFRLG
jgi:hypothetical protein